MDLQDVLKSTLVFILAGGQGERLYPLTKDRSKPSVHFAGIYRIIDFSLSNCLNSYLTRIIVLTQYKSLSLDRHIKTAWNLYFRESGNFIDVVPPQQRFDENWYMGTADAIFQNIYIIQHEKPEYVIILSGDHIYKMDYQKMLKYHIEKNADMTIAACEMPINEAQRFGILETDSNLKVVGFEEKPQYPKPAPGKENAAFVSMGIYIFTTDKLVRYVSDDHKSDSSKDFGKDIIPKIYETENVFAYNYVANEGERAYWRDIGTIASYYEAHKDIISISPILNLYDKEWPIRTFMEQCPPAKFIHNEEGRRGIAINSLIVNGSIISGGYVEQSIISPGVKVNSFSEVRGSIIMHGSTIGRYAKIQNAIIDKDNHIPEHIQIGYNLEEDKKHFMVSPEGIVIIPKAYVQ